MNTNFLGILLLNFILSPFGEDHKVPKEILEFYEKYKDGNPEEHLDEITPFINDYYKLLLEEYKLLINENTCNVQD